MKSIKGLEQFICDEMVVGKTYSTNFALKQSTIDKTIAMHNAHVIDGGLRGGDLESSIFELWGFPRVAYDCAGKDFEIESAGISNAIQLRFLCEVSDFARANAEYFATGMVTKKKLLPNGAVKVSFCTETLLDGKVVMKTDEVGLFCQNVTTPFYKESYEDYWEYGDMVLLTEFLMEVYWRYHWEGKEWERSVHHPEHAKLFGFRDALPEFITYLNALYAHAVRHFEFPLKIFINTIKPMYVGDKVLVKLLDGKQAQFVNEQGKVCLEAKLGDVYKKF